MKRQYLTPYPLEQLKAAINFTDGVGKCTRGRSVAYFSSDPGLRMSRATILESGVVIRCESFELQRFKVDQTLINFSVEFSNAHQTKIHTEMKLLKTYLATQPTVCEFGLFGG